MKQPAVFVAHGGGPLPLLGHPGHASLTKWLQSYSATLHAQPKAILVISAHWEVMLYRSPSLNDHNMTSKLPFTVPAGVLFSKCTPCQVAAQLNQE